MLTDSDIDQLLTLAIPEAQARETLLQLAPEQVDRPLLDRFVERMSRHCVPVPPPEGPVIDCCGTGGSGQSHYNTSTTVAFVLAAGGVPVVKFGNRAISSKSGSFDFLDGLGLSAQFPVEPSMDLLAEANLAFLYAPQCYPALGALNQLRRTLGKRTLFNFLGPLLNPVKPAYRLLGVSNSHMQALMAAHLSGRQENRCAWVVRGGDTLDELTCHGVSTLYHVADDQVVQSVMEHQYGGELHPYGEDLTVSINLKIFEDLVEARDSDSVYHRMVCLNAGAAFVVTQKVFSLEEGVGLAADLFRTGEVKNTLNKCRRAYASYTG